MSLAIYAAPFDNDSNNDNDNAISKKKIAHNRTQKKYPKQDINLEKVNSVIESIHNNSHTDDDDNNLGDYYGNPPPNPTSIGAQRASIKEGLQNNKDLNTLGAQPSSSSSSQDDNLELNNYQSNYGDNSTSEEYYKKYIPNFNQALINQQQMKHPYYKNNYYQMQNNTTMNATELSNDLLLKKLNYMINLLEEKQDERTNHVTEEVVLYSFLGIFIIFIVDSFARVGKYTR